MESINNIPVISSCIDTQGSYGGQAVINIC